MYMYSNRLIYKQHYGFHVAIKIYCVYFLKYWLGWYRCRKPLRNQHERKRSCRLLEAAKNRGPVYFKRSALLGRIKNRICLVRRTAFILALDSLGRTKSMLSRCVFHDSDSSLAKSTRYRLVQFLKQLFARCDSATAYCFPRSISRWLF